MPHAGGMCMPARAWAEFLDVYYRPHLLVVHLPTSTDSEAGRQLVDLLRRLIESLQSTADYAFLPEENEVKIAFEREIDFEVARGLLKATHLEVGGAEWASRAVCSWDP
jgi:hypothetical protein